MEEIKNKLTIQEAAPYLGQEILIGINAFGPDYSDVPVKLTAIRLHDLNEGRIEGKLILRSIEDMTEEDKIFIAKFIMKDLPSRFGEHHYEIDKYNGSVIVSVYNGGAILNVFYFNKNGIGRRYPINDFIVYKKLIELGFDLFDYIGQGKAIRKERG